MRISRVSAVALVILMGACAGGGQESGNPTPTQQGGRAQTQNASLPPAMVVPPRLPDSTGFGTHVLVIARKPTGETWIGTYGHGIYVFIPRARAPQSTAVRDSVAKAAAAPGGTLEAAPREQWTRIASRDKDSTSISWNFVNAFAFPSDSSVWYGTVGNGFGRSRDGGKTWRNWGVSQLGPQWQYVAPEGMRSRGDTVYIATADGLRITWDGGNTWRCVQSTGDKPPAAPARDGCTERINALPSKYLLAMDVGPEGSIWVGHLRGLSVSRDAGRTWRNIKDSENTLNGRVRAIAVGQNRQTPDLSLPGPIATTAPGGMGRPGNMGGGGGMGGGMSRAEMQRNRRNAPDLPPDSNVWVATENSFYKGNLVREDFKKYLLDAPGFSTLPGSPRTIFLPAFTPLPAVGLSRGLLAAEFDSLYHVYLGSGELYRPASDIWTGTYVFGRLVPIVGTSAGLDRVLPIEKRSWDLINPLPAGPAVDPLHVWFRRPITDLEGNPYIDQTYRYGSTMGGNFQQHQGVEFNNPAGTPVHAVGDGVVVFAGPAEAGANTVAIRHDRKWQDKNVYTVYYHNSSLAVQAGQQVHAGDLIAHVGNTGRATNDHLHLEVHVSASMDSAQIVNKDNRFPSFTVNPQLWIEPLPGTGIIAGKVMDATGKLIPGARVYGIVQPYPEETPFSFAETYMDKAHSDPAYGDNFAVGDVPSGRYLLGVDINGKKVWRTVTVQAGKVNWVEFKPETAE